MGRPLTAVVWLLLMVAVIVLADVLFFRDRFRARLVSNVGIVLVFLAFYWGVLNR